MICFSKTDGHALFYFPVYNYTHMNYDNVLTMMRHPKALPGTVGRRRACWHDLRRELSDLSAGALDARQPQSRQARHHPAPRCANAHGGCCGLSWLS